MGYSKADIDYHSDGFGRASRPAVNVKVYDSLSDGWRKWDKWNERDPAFTLEVVESFGDDYLNSLWEFACEIGWEMIEGEARDIYGRERWQDKHGAWRYRVNVYSEGRSGGWAVVDGPNMDVDEWDAIALGKWARFAKCARAHADDVMYQVVDQCHLRFEDDKAEALERERASREDIATVQA